MYNEMIELMREANIPLTRENYLNLIYFGDVPEDLDESDVPKMFQLSEQESPTR
jgi:hypothetical protein